MSSLTVDETCIQADKERDAGNYRGALELVRPFLLAREKLSLLQERNVVVVASSCYRCLSDFKAALPLAQRCVVLEQQLAGPRQLRHAQALKQLSLVQSGLKDFVAASKAIKQARAIMEELGMQRHEGYGSMLVTLGRLDKEQGQYKEALVIYDRAKAVLVQYKEGNEYGAVLNEMASCHQSLHQWNEAVACYKEAVEVACNVLGANHPHYATALYNLAGLFDQLKQYEKAIPRYEEALAIFQRVYGAQHEKTALLAQYLAVARQRGEQPNRDTIDVGHKHCMCNQCGKIKEKMEWCTGCRRVWYCDKECQLQHWATHKPLCNVCLHCDAVLTKIRRCSRCLKAKYCGAECSKAHWSEHKQDCVAQSGK
jgi:tetratricopeptide (TPR) repeat protein